MTRRAKGQGRYRCRCGLEMVGPEAFAAHWRGCPQGRAVTSGEQALSAEKNRARSRAVASVPKVAHQGERKRPGPKPKPAHERPVYPVRPPRQATVATLLPLRLPDPEPYLRALCPADPVRHSDPLRPDGTLDVERLSPARYAELVSIHRQARNRALKQSLGRELGVG